MYVAGSTLKNVRRRAAERDLYHSYGEVVELIGLTIASRGPRAALGELCLVQTPVAQVPAEVVGFRDAQVLLMALGSREGISPGCKVVATNSQLQVAVGPSLMGRVLDGLGRPIDGLGELEDTTTYPARNHPPNPLSRQRIVSELSIGVRSIDAVLTCGRGQRMGIFSGSGVGKSTVMGMVARNTSADVSVIALVGERGREVREFIERDLGSGIERAVVVVATSDQSALMRIHAANVATAIAEYFRDQGMDVVLMMDAVTRYATALREVGLAVGEPPATRGYTPSVFAELPRLLERSGTSDKGTITGFYSVLVEGDDMNEPVADAVRSILDGHVVLSRRLAMQGHYPAVDVLQSISRSMVDVVDESHLAAVQRLRSLLATYQEAEDLINIGAYVPGSNPRIDEARQYITAINGFLCQGVDRPSDFEQARASLLNLMQDEEVNTP